MTGRLVAGHTIAKAKGSATHASELTGPEKRVALLVQQAVARLRDSVGGPAVLAALEIGNLPAAAAALDWAGWRETLEGVEELTTKAWLTSGADTFVEAGGLRGAFGGQMPLATAWAARSTAYMIAQIDGPTRVAIRDLMARAVREGWSIPRTANALSAHVGLLPRQSTALANLEATLRASGMRDARVEATLRARAKAMLRHRCENIARTEVQAAVNAGRLAGWNHAALSGAIGPDAVKEWVTAPDERVCPKCAPMHGERRRLNDTFSHGGEMPPRHASCRCTAVIVDVGTVPRA